MFRFLSYLFFKEPFEECKSCEILKQQLALVNSEKRELTETLLSLLKPKVYEQPAVELQSMAPVATVFSRRRAALEQRDREAARVMVNSSVVGIPDKGSREQSIQQLEQQLNINEDAKEG